MELILEPKEIEKKSFEIITERLKGRTLDKDKEDIIKRAIHTSADFDYADNLYFSEGAVEKGLEALDNNATIITDTAMALSGISKPALKALNCKAVCFMSDPDVAEEAKRRGITRAMVSMERACEIKGRVIFAIGNAPTALLNINELYKEGRLSPALIIGVPVGFVNVVEAKEIIIESGIPCIVAKGNKGGSNIAAAISNALLYRRYKRE